MNDRAPPMKPTPTPALLPCPFCGSNELGFADSDIEGWISHVRCTDCDDMLGPMSEFKYDDVEDAQADAANVWNRRAALSVPAAAVVGEPVGMGVFRNGEMIGFVGLGDEFKLPEDTDERRPIYAAPFAPDRISQQDAELERVKAEARKAAFIEAAEIAVSSARDLRNGDAYRFASSHIAARIRAKTEETDRG